MGAPSEHQVPVLHLPQLATVRHNSGEGPIGRSDPCKSTTRMSSSRGDRHMRNLPSSVRPSNKAPMEIPKSHHHGRQHNDLGSVDQQPQSRAGAQSSVPPKADLDHAFKIEQSSSPVTHLHRRHHGELVAPASTIQAEWADANLEP
ncbi:hypothetical protein ACLOJK_004745 [Asimina triloba]